MSEQMPEDFGQEAADRILRRAIELESERGARVSLEQLRSVARDVGVSDAALEKALSEFEGAGHDAPPRQRRRRGLFGRFLDWARARRPAPPNWVKLIQLAALPAGMICCLTAWVLIQRNALSEVAVDSMLVACVLLAAAMMAARPRRSGIAGGVVTNLLFWIGFFLAPLLVEPNSSWDMPGELLMFTLPSLALGCLAMLIRNRTRGGADRSQVPASPEQRPQEDENGTVGLRLMLAGG
jgi:hypothetical protein